MASSSSPLNSAGLAGLRGLASIQVALSHIAFNYHKCDIVMGAAAIPVFFVLSGLLLTLSHAKRPFRFHSKADQDQKVNQVYSWLVEWLYPSLSDPSTTLQSSNVATFLWKRLSRQVPMYFVSNLGMMVVSYFTNYKFLTYWSAFDWFLTLTMTTSWVPGKLPAGCIFNWSTSTMLPFYLAFPLLVVWVQSLRNPRRVALQIFLGQMLVFLTPALLLSWEDSKYFHMKFYTVPRYNPILRLPVFVMGCCLAQDILQTLQQHQPAEVTTKEEDDNKRSTDSHATNSGQKRSQPPSMQVSLTDILFVLYLSCIALACWASQWGSDEVALGYAMYLDNLLARWILEATLPWIVYQLVKSLLLSAPSSSTADQFLSSAPLQWLGQVSFALFTTHGMVYKSLLAYVLNTTTTPNLTWWHTILTLVACLGVAHLFHFHIEGRIYQAMDRLGSNASLLAKRDAMDAKKQQ